MKRILIVEDESRIAAFLDKGLRRSGFVTEVATDGRTAHALAGSGRFDLVILDLGLPELDGFTVLRRLRSDHVEIPVIILTARDGVSDTVAGLEGGADDYVRKPFAFDELLARIRLRLRSSGRPEETTLRSGSLALDLRTRRAVVDGSPVDLTAREFGLLETFLDARGSGPDPRATPLEGLGLRLRSGVQCRRCLCALPAAQGRRRPDRDDPGSRVSARA